MDDLEALLDERLTLLRDGGGAGVMLHEARALAEERGRRRPSIEAPAAQERSTLPWSVASWHYRVVSFRTISPLTRGCRRSACRFLLHRGSAALQTVNRPARSRR